MRVSVTRCHRLITSSSFTAGSRRRTLRHAPFAYACRSSQTTESVSPAINTTMLDVSIHWSTCFCHSFSGNVALKAPNHRCAPDVAVKTRMARDVDGGGMRCRRIELLRCRHGRLLMLEGPRSLQLICHLGDAGHGAFLVALRARAAHADCADGLVADLDRHPAA